MAGRLLRGLLATAVLWTVLFGLARRTDLPMLRGYAALGSWWALAAALIPAILFVVRTAHEDRFLQDNLNGYRDNAARVRWRLVPGAW